MKYCLFILTAASLLLGCKKTTETNNFNSCNNTVSDILGGVEINVWENLAIDKVNRTLSFNSTTNDLMPCLGYELITCNKQIDHNFYISFDGLTVPDYCPSAIGRPRAPIDLGSFSNGNHNLNVRVNHHEYVGSLKISDTAYITSIAAIQDSDIVLHNDTLHKVPEHTIWGEVSYFYPSDSVLAKTTIQNIKALGAADSFYAPSNYGHFKIDQQNKISIQNIDALNYPHDFIFKYYGDKLTLKNFVDGYVSLRGTDFFQVIIYTSEGEVYRNF